MSLLHNRVYNINKLKQFTNFHTRLQFMNAYVIGKLWYMLPLYTQANNENINKIHKIIMRSARGVIGNYGCRFSISKILNICKWSTAKNMITHSAITTIHNIISNKKPIAIMNLFNLNNQRKSKQISTKYLPRTEQFKKIIFTIWQIYTMTYQPT